MDPLPQKDSSRRSFLQRYVVPAIAAGPAIMLSGGLVKSAFANDRHGHDDSVRWDAADEFMQIQGHENDHVDFLVKALGSAARPKPKFTGLEQKTFDAFVKVSQALENTGCGAYLGAAPVIFNRDYLAAAGSIALIEARHAGFLNVLRSDPITGDAMDDDKNNSFEDALTAAEVRDLAGPFIKSLNGGAAVDYSTTPSAANDIAILNFALALEYLEADFYNINVPKFFKHRR